MSCSKGYVLLKKENSECLMKRKGKNCLVSGAIFTLASLNPSIDSTK